MQSLLYRYSVITTRFYSVAVTELKDDEKVRTKAGEVLIEILTTVMQKQFKHILELITDRHGSISKIRIDITASSYINPFEHFGTWVL